MVMWENFQLRTRYALQVPLQTAPEWHENLRQCYRCEDMFGVCREHGWAQRAWQRAFSRMVTTRSCLGWIRRRL